MRVEHIGDAMLVLADSREWLKSLPQCFRVDAVVTDPPYGIDGGRGGSVRRGKGAYRPGSFLDTEEYIAEVCVPVVSAALEIAERGAVTPGTRCASFYPRPRDMGCFWTPAGVGCGPWGFVTFHPILFYGRDPRGGSGSLPTGRLLRPSNEEAVAHPCAKPLNDWTWLIRKVSLDEESVLDPFMGSGTTGVACANLGRKFIGIEIDPGYFDIACRRIEEAYRQPRLFAEPVPKIVQPSMFD